MADHAQRVSAAGSEKTTDHGVAKPAFLNRKDNAGVNVDWKPDGLWKDTQENVRKITGITSYKLTEKTAKEAEFKYELKFKTHRTAEYGFTDEDNDTHTTDASPESENEVLYNSNKPTIKYVRS